jgi:hypothetical protein
MHGQESCRVGAVGRSASQLSQARLHRRFFRQEHTLPSSSFIIADVPWFETVGVLGRDPHHHRIMSASQAPPCPFLTYVRWRPLPSRNTFSTKIQRNVEAVGKELSVSISRQLEAGNPETWKSNPSFAQVFASDTTNRGVFQTVIASTISQVLEGATCNVFAYGHTGSGKTHTIMGYDDDNDEQLGLVLASARALFAALENTNGSDINSKEGDLGRGLAISLYEVRDKAARALLNNGLQCHIREGADGQTYIRGPTEVLEGGRVRVRPIAAKPCWSFQQLHETVLAGLAPRKTGASEVHDQSSRTQAIIELEIIDKRLLDLRDAVIERESELVPAGKKATDVYIEEQMKSLIKTEDGRYQQNPDCPLDQSRIDQVEAEKKAFEQRLRAAEIAVAQHLATAKHHGLGGKCVLVDLAGSEFFDRNDGVSAGVKQTPKERQQGRQINTDLFALKEVIRARANGQARIPYRSSPLTMILRSHFEARGTGRNAMILTLSSEEGQFAATKNTLKYGNMTGSLG